jgi:hypothetical protein
MYRLTDNNGYLVARGSKLFLLRVVKLQQEFDASYALWLTDPNGKTKRVL